MNSSRQRPVLEPSAEGAALLRERMTEGVVAATISPNNSAGAQLDAFRDITVEQ